MRNLFYFLIAAGVLLIQSCHPRIVPNVPLPPKTIDIQSIDFEYLHGKARLNFKDNTREQEVKANIRIHKDSIIWMSFSVIGVQGGKALINKDSITVISSVNKEYYVYDYKELSKRFNFTVNYDVIQSALLGNPIIPRGETESIQEDADYNHLNQRQGTVNIRSSINKNTKKLERVELLEGGTHNQIKIDYSDFQPLTNKLFPYKGVIDLVYKGAKGIVTNTITFEYYKAEVGDKELRFPFNIPKRYDRR